MQEQTTPPDGQPAPEDSRPSEIPVPAPAVEVIPVNLKDAVAMSDATRQAASDTLKSLGLSPRMTRKLFAGRKDPQMLRREICGRISLVYFADSLDQLALAQKRCLNWSRKKGLTARDVALLLTCSVQAGNSVCNAGRIFMDAAGELDRESPKPPKPPTGDKQAPAVAVQFNFPQVAEMPAKPTVPIATSGD